MLKKIPVFFWGKVEEHALHLCTLPEPLAEAQDPGEQVCRDLDAASLKRALAEADRSRLVECGR
jgi:hypothetical protein